jgi:hypothetical protein
VDLSDVPANEYEVHRSPSGRTFAHLVYTVDISIQSSLDYSISVNGKKYGMITAKYA